MRLCVCVRGIGTISPVRERDSVRHRTGICEYAHAIRVQTDGYLRSAPRVLNDVVESDDDDSVDNDRSGDDDMNKLFTCMELLNKRTETAECVRV